MHHCAVGFGSFCMTAILEATFVKSSSALLNILKNIFRVHLNMFEFKLREKVVITEIVT